MKMSPWKWIGGCKCGAKPDDHPRNYPHGHFQNVETGGRSSLMIRSFVQGKYLLENNAGFKETDTSALRLGMEADVQNHQLPVTESGTEQGDLIDLMLQCLHFGVGITLLPAEDVK